MRSVEFKYMNLKKAYLRLKEAKFIIFITIF